jgi:hypothetical protein
MFEAKDEVKEAVDALTKLAANYERGQCIPWGVIEAITGDREDSRAKYVIGKFTRRLEREREIVTLAAVSVGIRLLTHRETAVEIPALRQRKAYRQIRRAIKQTATVDTSRLSDHERKLLTAQRANMAEQRRELFRSRKQLATGKVTETNPRRQVPK